MVAEAVLWLMAVGGKDAKADRLFAEFVANTEPRLRPALVAAYGPVDGRAAVVNALSWAWENWDRLRQIENKTGYLFRVAQSSMRPTGWRLAAVQSIQGRAVEQPEITPELVPALSRLSLQQRTVVLLVHAYGWSQADVASHLDISPSTVREHMVRGLERLRAELEVKDVC